jgi:hypothetical protein
MQWSARDPCLSCHGVVVGVASESQRYSIQPATPRSPALLSATVLFVRCPFPFEVTSGARSSLSGQRPLAASGEQYQYRRTADADPLGRRRPRGKRRRLNPLQEDHKHKPSILRLTTKTAKRSNCRHCTSLHFTSTHFNSIQFNSHWQEALHATQHKATQQASWTTHIRILRW